MSDLDGRGLVVAVFLEEVEDLGADPALGPRLDRPGHVLSLRTRQRQRKYIARMKILGKVVFFHSPPVLLQLMPVLCSNQLLNIFKTSLWGLPLGIFFF